MKTFLSLLLKSVLGIGVVASAVAVLYGVVALPALLAPAFVALFTLGICAIPAFYAHELRATYDDYAREENTPRVGRAA